MCSRAKFYRLIFALWILTLMLASVNRWVLMLDTIRIERGYLDQVTVLNCKEVHLLGNWVMVVETYANPDNFDREWDIVVQILAVWIHYLSLEIVIFIFTAFFENVDDLHCRIWKENKKLIYTAQLKNLWTGWIRLLVIDATLFTRLLDIDGARDPIYSSIFFYSTYLCNLIPRAYSSIFILLWTNLKSKHVALFY